MKSYMGGAKIGILYDASDVYSSGICDSSAENAKKLGLLIVIDEQFTADNKTDFIIQLQDLRNVGVDVVSIPFYYTEAALVLQRGHAMDYQPALFDCDAIDGIPDVDGFDRPFAEGLILLTPFSAGAEDAAAQHFTSAHREKYHEMFDQFAADAYDGMYTVKATAKETNITPAMLVPEIGSAMEQAMTEIRLQGATGTTTWGADGASSKEPKAVIIWNGVY